MPDTLTPRCPLCDGPPAIMLPGGIQAFCSNDDCTLLCWDPSRSLDENLMDTGFVHLPGDEPQGGGSAAGA